MNTTTIHRWGLLLLVAGVTGCGQPAEMPPVEPVMPPAAEPAVPAARVLFDGASLDGWVSVLTDPAVAAEAVWTVENGVLVCAGEPMGYLQSVDTFENAEVEVEYRWAPGETPGNSGVFVRINGEPRAMLPRAIEVQLRHGNAGDLLTFHGMSLDGDPERISRVPDHALAGVLTRLPRQGGEEREPGEWNRVRIRIEGETIRVWLNGDLVNEAKGLDRIAGHIGLQSEGGIIHFRNIRATPLP
jgi:hypothetical protein